MTPFIAFDWGTTNRCIHAIGGNGRVEATEREKRALWLG